MFSSIVAVQPVDKTFLPLAQYRKKQANLVDKSNVATASHQLFNATSQCGQFHYERQSPRMRLCQSFCIIGSMARICHRKVGVSALCIALHVAWPSGTEFCIKIRASGSNYDLRRLQRIFVGNFSLKDRKLSFQYAKL